MSTVTPAIQPRNGHPRNWGNYPSAAVLPNAAGWPAGPLPGGVSPTTAATPLELGDEAVVVGVGPYWCFSAGSPGLLDAVWVPVGSSSSISVAQLPFTTLPTDKPVWSKTFSVVDARVTPASVIVVSQSGNTATGRVGNDLEWDQILLGAVAGTGTFEVTAYAVPGPIVGNRVIIYQIF